MSDDPHEEWLFAKRAGARLKANLQVLLHKCRGALSLISASVVSE